MELQNGICEVVLVTINSAQHIGPCVQSVVAEGAVPVIADNASSDATLEIVRSVCPGSKVLAIGKNVGYGQALNLAFKETAGDIVILSNPDVVYLDGSIIRLVEFMKQNPKIGIAGPQQVFPDMSWQRSYGDLPGIWSGLKDAVGITTMQNSLRRAFWPHKIDCRPKEVPYVDGAIMAVRREAFEAVKGFNNDVFMYAEESDLCARVRKEGWKVFFYPEAQAVHVRGASSVRSEPAEHFLRMQAENQYLLALKCLPAWKAWVYARLQVVQFWRLASMYRFLRSVRGTSESCNCNIRVFEALGGTWRELCGERSMATGRPRN